MKKDTDKVIGRAKQAAGDLADNEDLKDEGKTQETAGKAKEAIDNAAEKLSDTVNKVRDRLS